MNFLGAAYPITRHPRGFLRTQSNVDQIKSDLLVLLLTEPGERVMLPDFGTPLRQYFFEPNDLALSEKVKKTISDSISMWEPRIAVQNISVSLGSDVASSLNYQDLKQDIGHILLVKIDFVNFNDIQKLEQLSLEIPLGG
jgi:hypothetical protein